MFTILFTDTIPLHRLVHPETLLLMDLKILLRFQPESVTQAVMPLILGWVQSILPIQ